MARPAFETGRPRAAQDGYRPIADYGLIGDAHGAALVSSDGSIDWCCMPDMDDPALFLRLLDVERGGAFSIRPASPDFVSEHRYLPDTNVLETTFRTATGVLRLWDAFAMGNLHTNDGGAHRCEILRLAECVEGTVEVELSCWVTPDFARIVAPAEPQGETTVRWRWQDGEAWLAGSWPLQADGAVARSRQVLQAGARTVCVFSDVPPADSTSLGMEHRLHETALFWRSWAGRCEYAGAYRDTVVRSALTLKLLTFRPTGAIVAAPTTSLPEEIGGIRNWDYRYCWLRDATFTLYALGLLGYRQEAYDFMRWVQWVCISCGTDLRIMYGVRTEHELPEFTLDHLSGYRNSRPVRVGNAAHTQRQLDVYGAVLDSAYAVFAKQGGAESFGERFSGPMWHLFRDLVDFVADHWEEPDSGIWEVRTRERHFVFSKVMCWVALDRGLRLARMFDLPADRARWQQERDRIRAEVLQRGYSPQAGAFTQTFDSGELDASALMLPLVGFIPATDPRMLSTINAIDTHLTRNGLVYRYLDEDGLPGGEGAFSICTFWLIDCLIMAGRLEEATARFALMLEHANDLGLYSEEIDPDTGEFLGNFPQGFSHIALINTAVNLDKAARGQAQALPTGQAMP